MPPCKSPISTCRYCRFYQPEGMHGGSCHQLDVPVRGEWTACSLAMPAFTPNWTGVNEIAPDWQDTAPAIVAEDRHHEEVVISTTAAS